MSIILRPSTCIFLVLSLSVLTASAAPVLEGRLADGTPSQTCAVSGPMKCAAFYYKTLDLTILNERINGSWSANSAVSSVQSFAESIGFESTGLTNWMLPKLEHYGSLYFELGPADWQYHFGSYVPYWTSEVYPYTPDYAWTFDLTTGTVFYKARYAVLNFSAFATRIGDMPTPIPEPATYVQLLSGILGLVMATLWGRIRNNAWIERSRRTLESGPASSIRSFGRKNKPSWLILAKRGLNR